MAVLRCVTLLLGLALLPMASAAAEEAAPQQALFSRTLPSDTDLKGLESTLSYTFTNRWLLRQALVHPSFGEWNNHRFSWLGDAIMTAVVSDLLYKVLPEAATTERLHEERKKLVGRAGCADGAKDLGLDRLLVVGAGYLGKEPTVHMLAEAFEAVWGALYVDAGFSFQPVQAAYARCVPIHIPDEHTLMR